MNWVERLPEIKGKDLYSQNGEGLIIEYIISQLDCYIAKRCADIGSGDGFVLSNSRHMYNLGWQVQRFDKTIGKEITVDNCLGRMNWKVYDFFSIDIDGNDYWVLDKLLERHDPKIIVAEFNAMYTDSRTIAYNPDHVWAGDSYYGFTFEAGKKLAEKHGYKVIFQLADMNMFMVRADLIEGLTFPEVTYKQNDFFKLSTREDWVYI